MIDINQFNELTANYINQCNQLLNIICEVEDYMLFQCLPNKTYVDSLVNLVDNYKNIKGNYPKAVVISEDDYSILRSNCFIIKKLISPKITFITREKAISDYLAKQIIHD